MGEGVRAKIQGRAGIGRLHLPSNQVEKLQIDAMPGACLVT